MLSMKLLQITNHVAQSFVMMHRSVVKNSDRMLFELKRHNYVTPTNYLELVTGYIKFVCILLFTC